MKSFSQKRADISGHLFVTEKGQKIHKNQPGEKIPLKKKLWDRTKTSGSGTAQRTQGIASILNHFSDENQFEGDVYCIGSKFDHQVALFALVVNLAFR